MCLVDKLKTWSTSTHVTDRQIDTQMLTVVIQTSVSIYRPQQNTAHTTQLVIQNEIL